MVVPSSINDVCGPRDALFRWVRAEKRHISAIVDMLAEPMAALHYFGSRMTPGAVETYLIAHWGGPFSEFFVYENAESVAVAFFKVNRLPDEAYRVVEIHGSRVSDRSAGAAFGTAKAFHEFFDLMWEHDIYKIKFPVFEQNKKMLALAKRAGVPEEGRFVADQLFDGTPSTVVWFGLLNPQQQAEAARDTDRNV